MRDVVPNLVRAGMLGAPGDWPWSSDRATAAVRLLPAFLNAGWLLRAFAERRAEAVTGYRRLVAEGIGAAAPGPGLKGQIDLRSEPCVERIQALIDPKRTLREIPKRLTKLDMAERMQTSRWQLDRLLDLDND
jgi:hypothetical protein